MIHKLKPLHKQVIFITGATSGIGLVTVHRAVEQGARVFMTARNEDELLRIQDEMRHMGYETAFSVADVAEMQQLQVAVEQCLHTFGKIDTFINNAGIGLFAKVMDTNLDEAKRLFDTNFWGVVNGCKVAVPVMREGGGVIINIGSFHCNVALPMQGLFSASEHALKGLTNALRRELMAEHDPIQVTLLLPSAINTPYNEHARSHIGVPGQKPPVYSADVVAKAILRCATKPTRELGIGVSSYFLTFLDRWFPQLQDKIMSRSFMGPGLAPNKSDLPKGYNGTGSLFQIPKIEGEIKGSFKGHVRRSSLMTEIAQRKGLLKNSLLSGGLMYFVISRFFSSPSDHR
jgi:short-subunit dehydrogenase